MLESRVAGADMTNPSRKVWECSHPSNKCEEEELAVGQAHRVCGELSIFPESAIRHTQERRKSTRRTSEATWSAMWWCSRTPYQQIPGMVAPAARRGVPETISDSENSTVGIYILSLGLRFASTLGGCKREVPRKPYRCGQYSPDRWT